MNSNSNYYHKWGYKGLETAINGLIKWLDRHIDLNTGLNEKYEVYFRIIIDYGENKLPDLTLKGESSQKADKIAKKINEQSLFKEFVQYVKTNYNVLEKPRTTYL